MFLRKLTVIMIPLCMLLALCLLMPLLFSLDWYFGGLFIGCLLGVLLSLLLPLAGATRLREPFAWLLWVPAAVILLILLYQYLASVGTDRTCRFSGCSWCLPAPPVPGLSRWRRPSPPTSWPSPSAPAAGFKFSASCTTHNKFV